MRGENMAPWVCASESRRDRSEQECARCSQSGRGRNKVIEAGRKTREEAREVEGDKERDPPMEREQQGAASRS